MVGYTTLLKSKFSFDLNAFETVRGSTAWLAKFLPRIETNYITEYRAIVLISQTYVSNFCLKMASKKF